FRRSRIGPREKQPMRVAINELPLRRVAHHGERRTVAWNQHEVMRVGFKHAWRVGPAADEIDVLIDDILRIDRIVTAVDKNSGRGRRMPNEIFAAGKIAQDITVQIMPAHEGDGADGRIRTNCDVSGEESAE